MSEREEGAVKQTKDKKKVDKEAEDEQEESGKEYENVRREREAVIITGSRFSHATRLQQRRQFTG